MLKAEARLLIPAGDRGVLSSSLYCLLVRQEGLMLRKGSGVGIGSLLLRLLHQESLLMSEKGLLLLRCERRRPLAWPHVDSSSPRVL